MNDCIRRAGSEWTLCPCTDCRTEMSRKAKRARNGIRVVNDQRPAARRRIDAWAAAGYSIGVVADMTGIRKATLARHLSGQRTEISHATAVRVMAADPIPGDAAGFIPSIGTVRRLRALTVMGWSMHDVAELCGVKESTLHALRDPQHTITRPRYARAVRNVYDRLSMTHGTCRYAATRAIRKGWAPPTAYDEETIDDPSEEIDHMARKNAGITRWTPLEERFWSRVDKRADGGCWAWTGRIDDKGYGQKVGHEGRRVRPHRLSYELLVGPIPDGLVLDHLCRVRHCVNPEHLDPCTAEENTARGVEARWSEECPNGHDPEHRRALPSGKNVCTECRRESDRARDERDREQRRQAARERYAAAQRTKKGALVEDVEWWLGVEPMATAQQCGDRLGVTRDAIQQACRRAERLDLLAQLARNASLAA